MPKLVHADFITLANLLGYDMGDQGICRGFSCMLAQAIFLNDTISFEKRLEFMATYKKYNDNFSTLKNDIEKAKNKPSPFNHETTKQLLEILAFFDGIKLYHQPYTQSKLFNEFVFQQNLTAVYPFTKSQDLEKSNLNILLNKEYAFNSRDNLTGYLSELATVLSQTKRPLPILLSSFDHTVLLNYNKTNNTWFYVDINDFSRYPQPKSYFRILNLNALSNSIYASFSKNSPYLVLNMQVLTNSTLEINSLNKLFKKFELRYPIKPKHLTINDKNGNNLLHLACQIGNLNIVKQSLNDNNVDINKANIEGITPLHMACQNGHLGIVKSLLTKNTLDVNKADPDGVTPLYLACQNGHLEIVKSLLTKDTLNVNKARITGITSLCRACQKGHIEIVDLLLSSKKINNINALGVENYTVLMEACCSPQIKEKQGLFSLLLNYGASLTHKSEQGQTALDVALEAENNPAIEELLVWANAHNLPPDAIMSPNSLAIIQKTIINSELIVYLQNEEQTKNQPASLEKTYNSNSYSFFNLQQPSQTSNDYEKSGSLIACY